MQPTESTVTDLKAFKHAVRRRALRFCALALIVVAAMSRAGDMYGLIGLIFGACIGFVNMNLMFFNLARMQAAPKKARARTTSIAFMRFAIIVAAGCAGIYKNFNPYSMAAGFLLTYAAIITIPITDRLKLRFLAPKANPDEN